MSISMPATQNPQHQADICVTCLSASQDDALHPFTQDLVILLKHLLHEFDLDGCLKLLPSELKLCQLCHKRLKDMVAFKETALKSLKQLKNLWRDYLSKTAKPSTSQMQHENLMTVIPKAEPVEPDPLDCVKLEVNSNTHESRDVLIDIKEEIIENNGDSDRESGESEKIYVEIDDNVVTKKEPVVSQQIIDCNNSANVYKVSIVNSTKMSKAKNKNISKNESNNIRNPISMTQQNATISAVPQCFSQTIGTLKALRTLPFVTMPLIPGTQGAASQLKFVNLITANAGTSNLVPLTQPLLVKYPDGTTKLLNPTMPATVAYPTTRVTAPRATTTTAVPRYTSKNKLLHSSTKSAKVAHTATSTKESHEKSSTKSPKTVFCTNNRGKEIIELSECDSSHKDKVEKKKPKVKQYPWYVTVLTREQLRKYREEKLKDPMFIKAPFKCMSCGVYYNGHSLLLDHQDYCNRHSKENAEFPCPVCDCSFDTLKLYTRHFRSHTHGCHLYQCPTCDYNVTSIGGLSVHKCPNKGSKEVPPIDPKMVLSRSRRQFYCPKCEFVSIHSITTLYKHYHCTHKNDYAVKCDVCGKFYSSKYACTQHMKLRHQDRAPVAFCAPCELPFYYMSAYRTHMDSLKHASDDQFIYECDECPKKFHKKKVLEEHKKMHMEMAGEKSHVCPVCGRGYQRARSLASHLKSKHSVRARARSHVCEVCGDAFTTNIILRQHMVRHSDARPYKCKFCDDTFKQTGARYTHMKLKHKYVKTKLYDKGKKERAISARNKTERKLENSRAHEQSIETHEHEQSTDMSPDGSRETMDYDQILELQTFDNAMES